MTIDHYLFVRSEFKENKACRVLAYTYLCLDSVHAILNHKGLYNIFTN